MYVAKFSKSGIRWDVKLFNKSWSSEMLSNEVKEIASKRFFLHSSGYRWVHKRIIMEIVSKHGLEIID